MPRIRSMMLCLAVLMISACANQQPKPHINTPPQAQLSSLQRFSLSAADAADDHIPAQQTQLQGLLLKALTQRGYQQVEPADIHVLYWFKEHTAPLPINVDTPPSKPLGPYQAIHRLKSVSATLHVQLRDTQQRILWEGQIETPLSPENDRVALLDQAVQNLMNELPRSGS